MNKFYFNYFKRIFR